VWRRTALFYVTILAALCIKGLSGELLMVVCDVGVVAVSLAAETATTTTGVTEDRGAAHGHATVGAFYIVQPRLCSLC